MRRRDNTGRWFDELYDPDTLRRIQSTMAVLITTGVPTLYRSDLSAIGKPHRRHHCLVMPLARDGRTVDMAISIPDYG